MTEHADTELLSIYISLYFDEDISNEIVENLRQRGFDVLCARDTQRLSLADDAQLAFAVAQERAIVTHNRHDFEKLHKHYLENKLPHWGIIIAKRRRDSTIVVRKLLALLDSFTAEEFREQLQYV
jgi:acetolactate synthase regulatory subunit